MSRALFLCALLGVFAVAHAGNWTLLFGMSSKVEFESISTTTAQPVQTGVAFNYTLQAQGLSSIDTTNGIYYIIGLNDSSSQTTLVGISTDSGNILTETNLPFAQEFFVGVGQYVDVQTTTNQVLVVGPDATSAVPTLYVVNPTTHIVKKLSIVGSPDPLAILGGASVYDGSVNMFWMQYAFNDTGAILFRMYGYDANDGTLLNMVDGSDNFGAMSFDGTTGLIYALGSTNNGTAWVPGLYTFSSQTTQSTLIAPFNGYVSYMSAEIALDFRHRRAYAFMTTQSPSAVDYAEAYRAAKPHAPRGTIDMKPLPGYQGPLPGMDLVTIDMDTGVIVSTVSACAQFPDCPWSIEYQ